MNTNIRWAAMCLAATAVAFISQVQGEKMDTQKEAKRSPGLYATFNTTMGDFVVKLHKDAAPKTVENFVGLATGAKEFTDPKTGQKAKRPFYDGLTFHRVIPGFMIQGGDPVGNGTGGPGYKFEDEFASPHVFDKPGILAMANAGPNTNGSQFFVTVAETSWLNKRHTIFGEVVEGYPVVEKISKTERDGNDRPLKPVIINKLSIEEWNDKGRVSKK